MISQHSIIDEGSLTITLELSSRTCLILILDIPACTSHIAQGTLRISVPMSVQTYSGLPESWSSPKLFSSSCFYPWANFSFRRRPTSSRNCLDAVIILDLSRFDRTTTSVLLSMGYIMLPERPWSPRHVSNDRPFVQGWFSALRPTAIAVKVQASGIKI